jgi:hypothetical protein
MRSRLEQEEATLARWLTRLKRVFHAFEKQQRRVAALQRQLAKLQE